MLTTDKIADIRAAVKAGTHTRDAVPDLLAEIGVHEGEVQGLKDEIRQLREHLRQQEERAHDAVHIAQQRLTDLVEFIAAAERIQGRHAEFRIYDDCGHEHTDADPGVLQIFEVGLVCEDGYVSSICRACCAGGGEGQVECCANDHDGPCWPCPTKKDLELGGPLLSVSIVPIGQAETVSQRVRVIAEAMQDRANKTVFGDAYERGQQLILHSASKELLAALSGAQPEVCPTDEEITTAIETLQRIYRSEFEVDLIELMETVRNEETLHVLNEDRSCERGADCVGCNSERIATAVTRAVLGLRADRGERS